MTMTMTRNRWPVLAFLFISFLPSWVLAGQNKIATDLRVGDPTSIVDVIVQFKELPTEADHGRIHEHGGTLKSELPIVKGALYSVPGSERLLNQSPRARSKRTGDGQRSHLGDPASYQLKDEIQNSRHEPLAWPSGI